MTSSFTARRALVAAALATATAGSLMLPAAPASAAPAVDGYVDAFGYARSNIAECNPSPDTVSSHREFTASTGRRTASVERSFEGTLDGDPTVTAHGRVENTSSGVADANNGAFNEVTFRAEHLVRITDDAASNCGMGIIADTQTGADLVVKRRGRVHLEWDRGRAGQIEQILVSRNGNVKVDKQRPAAHGQLTFRVRPGEYLVFVQYVTRANEGDIPTGATLTKRSRFRVALDYRR